jgi:radical SAM superfamily enzyme YgiQ (UPF0313 family)
MYKSKRYRQKNWSEIEQLIAATARKYPRTRRIFLADGDALSLPTDTLLQTLENLYASFPSLERVSIYGGPKDALNKTDTELKNLREKGLNLVFLGIESGSETILKEVKKGVSPQEMIEAGTKLKNAGLKLSATVISGLGGKKHWENHAIETARVVSAINPDYLASLTLVLQDEAPLLRKMERGEFEMLTPWEVLKETRLYIDNLHLSGCTYRSNHVSNYFSLACILNEEKEAILKRIDQYLTDPHLKSLPVDNNRML